MRAWRMGLLAIALVLLLAPGAWGAGDEAPLPWGLRWSALATPRIAACGNAACGWVRLDGYGLFQLAVPAIPVSDPAMEATACVEARITKVETALQTLVRLGLQAERRDRAAMLALRASTLNSETVLIATNPALARPLALVTVTDFDAQQAGLHKEVLAQDWKRAIEEAIASSSAERQPAALWRQGRRALVAAAVALVAAAAIRTLQRRGARRSRRLRDYRQHCLHQQRMAQPAEDLAAPPARDGLRRWLAAVAPWLPCQKAERVVHSISPWFSAQQQLNRLLWFEWVLRWSQALLAGGVLALLLMLFPQTRALALQLGQKPLHLLAIWLGTGLAIALANRTIHQALGWWAENRCASETHLQRYALRIPTYSLVLHNLVRAIAYLVAIALSLEALGVPVGALVAGAGLVAAGLSFGAQSSIKDLFSGGLILLTDQYAIGDAIETGGVTGVVERINLYVTQIRSPDGDLISLPNGSIGQVANKSNEWSRVNFAIAIAYEADVDRALQLLTEVAAALAAEPEWCEQILSPAQVLGVDEVTHAGLLLRVWIQTQPLQQWPVGREFRRRVKLAFDRAGIAIGTPQQVWHAGDRPEPPAAASGLPPRTLSSSQF